MGRNALHRTGTLIYYSESHLVRPIFQWAAEFERMYTLNRLLKKIFKSTVTKFFLFHRTAKSKWKGSSGTRSILRPTPVSPAPSSPTCSPMTTS